MTNLLKNSTFLLGQLTSKALRIRNSSTYKAAVIRGTSNSFSVEEVARTKLGDNQVRIQVHYCSLNSNDLPTFHENGKGSPFTPGYEIGGEVIELGKNVTKNQIILGEKVAALNLERMGGFAEECVTNVEDMFRLPSNLPLKDAAILISGHSLALLAFSKMTKIKKDDYVVISAGSGGLGLAAVDIAANVYGAKVIGVVDSSDKADLLRDRGAFKTVQPDSKLQQQVLKAAEKKNIKVVYDAVGSSLTEPLANCVSSGGQIFLAGSHLYESIPTPPFNTNLAVLDLIAIKNHDLEAYRCLVNDVLDLADQGLISAHVSASFALGDINKAIEFIQEKKCTGKVLIRTL
uniref:Enoyl reductase (ER) domain-containing protein n=1 Tax=Photinus pyralis TaxID=7054 RepID=A0A1Y1KTW2_PHOPY